jgi:hypothetical protein
MLTRGFAFFLVVLCIVPTTAPFSIASMPLSGARDNIASAATNVIAQSVSDDNNDAIALERSTFLSQSRACACSTSTHAVRVNGSMLLAPDAPALASLYRPPIFRVLRV